MAGGNLTSVFSEALAPSSARLGPVVVCKGNKTVFYLCFPYSLTQCGSSFWPSWNMLKQNQRGRGGGTSVKRNKEKSGSGGWERGGGGDGGYMVLIFEKDGILSTTNFC